jgi:hypothetical protein
MRMKLTRLYASIYNCIILWEEALSFFPRQSLQSRGHLVHMFYAEHTRLKNLQS